MATELGRVKSTAASKSDAFVASQLKQAEKRIRMFDLTAGLFGFAALSLAYIVGMLLFDSKFLLSQHVRQLSLYVFLAGAAVYLYFAVLRPLRLRVNPYYAARQIEQRLPHAKNSIVNWVDLREQPLPPAIRGALGQRAAKDLSRVDLERTISSRRAAWMGGLAGLFAVAFLVLYFLLGPAPFLSLLKRTFNPFETVGVSTRTRLTLLKPAGGNAMVTVGRGINFVVDVGGKIPDPKAADAVKLVYRYDEGDPWLERRLIQEASGEWTASLSAIEVKNGFWYKVTGGDAATEEYQVNVRAALAITDFLATYRFRPYLARADEVHHERELKALRGTEILLRVPTNRTLREGRLEFERNGGAGIVKPLVTFVNGQTDAQEPNTFLVRFILNEDGKYRLSFTSTEGEAYRDPASYTVTAIPDQPPTVELTKPGKDIRLPVDALLHLEGKAGDDIGVRSLILQMRVIGGDKLRGQPYRSEEQLRLADGGYPRELEYKDFVELSRVQSEDGRTPPLRPGMELEYWLEASDACDYPHPNVAESKHYRVLLTEPDKNDLKKNQEKKQAEKDKKQHEQKQDQKLQKENQERRQQRQEQQARNKEEENRARSGSEGKKGAAGEKSQPNEGEHENKSEGKQHDSQPGESRDGQGEASSSDQKNELSKKEQNNIEERIKKALEKKQADENGKSEGKAEKGDKGESKGAQQNNADGGDGSRDKSKGENKGSGTENAKKTGEGKEKGQQQSSSDRSQRDSKGAKNDPKSGDRGNQTGDSAESKSEPESAPQSGEKKSGADSQASKNANQGKEKPPDQGQKPATDGNNSAGEKSQQSKGTEGRKDDGKPNSNQGNRASENKPSAGEEAKPSDNQPKGEESDKNQNKQEAGSPARNATAKDVADLARALQSKDAGERQKAQQQLQRIAKQADDAEARKQAGQALEKGSKQDSSSGNSTAKNGGNPAAKSSEERREGAKNDGSKSAERSKGEGSGKKANSSEKKDQNGKKRPGSSSDEGRQGSPTSKDGTPGGGGDRRSGKGASGVSPSEPKQPDKPRDHRAAQMQLEDFAKRVDKNILKEAGVTEKDWKEYLEARRKQLTPPEKPRPEAPSAPQQAKQLPSMGGRTIQPSASGQNDTQSPDRGKPPPGYRDSFRKFTQQMSKNK
jgi:collagen type III alpha